MLMLVGRFPTVIPTHSLGGVTRNLTMLYGKYHMGARDGRGEIGRYDRYDRCDRYGGYDALKGPYFVGVTGAERWAQPSHNHHHLFI